MDDSSSCLFGSSTCVTHHFSWSALEVSAIRACGSYNKVSMTRTYLKCTLNLGRFGHWAQPIRSRGVPKQARSSGGLENAYLWVPTTAVSVTQTQSGLIFLNSFCGASPPQGHLLYVESVRALDSTKGRSDAVTPTRRGLALEGE